MDRPILFSDAMVRAIVSGAKTQTRRLVDVPPGIVASYGTDHPVEMARIALAYGSGEVGAVKRGKRLAPLWRLPFAPGDRLWVRECWTTGYGPDLCKGLRFRADDAFQPVALGDLPEWEEWDYRRVSADHGRRRDGTTQFPNIHMPRWASRLTLPVVSVRVERLQDISEADARAEGVEHDEDEGAFRVPGVEMPRAENPGFAVIGWPTARRAFEHLWSSVYGADSWSANPWVWVVEWSAVLAGEREARRA
jgi:hypothetical protein